MKVNSKEKPDVELGFKVFNEGELNVSDSVKRVRSELKSKKLSKGSKVR